MISRARALGLAVCVVVLCGAAPAPIVTPTVGGEPWTSEGIAKLDAELDTMLATDSALRGAHVGIYAIDTASGTVLYTRAADEEFQPASTLKLLVGSAALDRLGPSYRFHTSLATVGTGDATQLVLHAGGDPLLGKGDFDEAIRAIVAARIPALRRDLAIDDARYDAQPYPAGWTWDDFPYAYAPRISALTFEENVVHVDVAPGASIGALARVGSAPVRAMRASSEGCAATVDVAVTSRVTTAAKDSDPDALDIEREPGGCIAIVGTIPLGGAPQTVDAAVPSPALYAYDYLAGGLRDVVKTIETRVDRFPFEHRYEARADAAVPSETIRWKHDSPPLGAWLGSRFWIPSDNLVGEVLLKELGFVAGSAPGTTLKGTTFEKEWLRTIGVDPATVTLADGCGMSQYDRITPHDLVTILQHDWRGPNRALVLDSLPVGGSRGTIEGIAETGAAGRVFAKTGSMMHVRGLAGYLATVRHGTATFAFEVDDWNGAYPALAALRARLLARIIRD